MAISLESILQTPSTDPESIVLYARPGLCKTTFACQAPNPIVLPTEEGFGTLSPSRFPLLKSYQEIIEALTILAKEDHNYETVVIDTLTNAQKLIYAEQVRLHNLSAKEGKEITSVEDVAFAAAKKKASELWDRILNALTYLKKEKGMRPILLAHVEVEKISPPDADPYDRYTLALDKYATPKIIEWADIVLFGTTKVRFRTVGQGFTEEKKALGGEDRVLLTEYRAVHDAKNRYNLPYEISIKKENSWDTFYQLLEEGKKK